MSLTREDNERSLRAMRAKGLGGPSGADATVGMDRAFLLLDEVDLLRGALTDIAESLRDGCPQTALAIALDATGADADNPPPEGT
jgi:hypothetical protein